MQKSDLALILKTFESRLPNLPCRLFPSSFDPHDPDLYAFPRTPLWRWHSIEETLRDLKVTGVAQTLPFFWQLESPIFEVCRSIKSSLFVTQGDNLPLLAASVQGARIDTIISEPNSAEALSLYMRERNMPLPRFVLVHQPDKPLHLPRTLQGATVVHEIHLMPGMPVLRQCKNLYGTIGFHLLDEWDGVGTPEGSYITNTVTNLIPLIRYQIPALALTGICSCGKQTFERV